MFDIGGTKAYDGVHQTSGIDVYVTAERTILLDSQVCVTQCHIILVINVACVDHFAVEMNVQEMRTTLISFLLTSITFI